MTANPVIDISMDDGFDLETDLLVAGAGAGGMAAALFARLEGLAVIVAEKTGEAGGTAATSAGTLWIPGNTQSREAGYADNPADAARYMDGLIGNGGNCSVRQAYLDSGPGAINRLMAETDVQFLACGRHPDYLDRPGAAVSGRAIIPVPFDGRQLHGQFARIRAPMREFMVFGGMMVGKSDIPRPVIGTRNSTRQHALEEHARPEEVLWHQKVCRVDSRAMESSDTRFAALTEVFRLDLRRWLAHTDDPKQRIVFADPDDAHVYAANAPRVYNIAIVYRLRRANEENAPWKRIRVIVSRKGIQRIEHVC